MAFCGKCGQKNPDGAAFCSACGAPLTTVNNGTERIILHKDGTPPPPRVERPTQEKEKNRNPWEGNLKNRETEQPHRNRGFEKPVKKGGTFGGCLKKLLLWFIGIVVLLGLLLWGIGSCLGDSDGGGGSERGNDQIPYERVLSESALQSLIEKKNFEKNNGDVAVRAGRYVGKASGETITFDVTPAANSSLAGKINVMMGGETIRTCVFAYCGNGIYAMYNGESIYDDPDEYFQALPDHETITWANGYSDITLTYQGQVPAESD